MVDRLLLSILAICLLQVSQVTCQAARAENSPSKQAESKSTTASAAESSKSSTAESKKSSAAESKKSSAAESSKTPTTAEKKTTETKPSDGKSPVKSSKPADEKSPAKASDQAKGTSGLPKVMDMGASWCVPCKKFSPIFDKVAENYKGKVDFLHYDVESKTGKPVAEKYKVDILPTVIFLDSKGKVVLKKEEKMTEAELVKYTDNLLK